MQLSTCITSKPYGHLWNNTNIVGCSILLSPLDLEGQQHHLPLAFLFG